MKTDKYNLKRIEKNMIISALNYYKGNRTHAALDLGISVRTLRNKLHQYDIAGYLLKPQYKAKMKRFWVTWETSSECYLPMTWPPMPSTKGWWEVHTKGSISTLCGVVDEESIKEAKIRIIFDWPEATNFKFCKMKPDWKPSKKYKLEQWMTERLNEA